MTNNKQSSVEWLIEQVKSKEWQDMFIWHKEEIFEQAKQIEKEQILRSFSVGNDCGYCFAKTEDTQQYNSGEQYYNENYNK